MTSTSGLPFADLIDTLTPFSVVLAAVGGVVVLRRSAAQTSRLRDSEQRYHSMIQHDLAMICSIDIRGRIEFMNPAMESATRLGTRDVLGLPFEELIDSEEAQTKWRALFSRVKKGQCETLHVPVLFPNGRRMELGMKTVPIVVNSKVVGLHAISRDITELRRSQNTIRQLQHRQNLILHSAEEGILGIDLDGRIHFCNPASARITGFSMHEMLNKNLHDLLHHTRESGEPYPASECPILQTVRIGTVHRAKHETIWHRDGRPFPIEFTSAPLRDRGKIVGGVLIFQDITERKVRESLLRRSERLAVAGQLAAGVAHEIRNPLTALRGFVQLMKEGADKGAYLDIMLEELDHIDDIVSEFLLLAKPQGASRTCEDLDDIMTHVIALIETQAVLAGVRLHRNAAAGLPLVRCVRNQLHQVFINILQNAIAAMPLGGDVRIHLYPTQDHRVVVRIEDEGIGISADQMTHLGEAFYTTKEKGTGLGLMVSYKIIEEHCGTIGISSQVGNGTTVEITLPSEGCENTLPDAQS